MLTFYAAQIYYAVWLGSEEGQSTYAQASDACVGMVDTASSGLTLCMIVSCGILPGVVLVHAYLYRYHPTWLASDVFLIGDPTRPEAPPPEVQLRVTQHGVREVIVRKARGMSERQKLKLKKKMIKDLASRAEQDMLKHFHTADMGDPDRAMTLREARQLKAAATNKEQRATAAAYLAKKKFKKEEKRMLERIEEARLEKEAALKEVLGVGGGGSGSTPAKARRRRADVDDLSDEEQGVNPWRSRVLAAQKVHVRRSAVLTAAAAPSEVQVAPLPDGADDAMEDMFRRGIAGATGRSKESYSVKSFTKGDSGRPAAWRVGSYYAAVDV